MWFRIAKSASYESTVHAVVQVFVQNKPAAVSIFAVENTKIVEDFVCILNSYLYNSHLFRKQKHKSSALKNTFKSLREMQITVVSLKCFCSRKYQKNGADNPPYLGMKQY
jgi:hypothetical protein